MYYYFDSFIGLQELQTAYRRDAADLLRLQRRETVAIARDSDDADARGAELAARKAKCSMLQRSLKLNRQVADLDGQVNGNLAVLIGSEEEEEKCQWLEKYHINSRFSNFLTLYYLNFKF